MFADTGHSTVSSGRPFPAAHAAHDAAIAATKNVPNRNLIFSLLIMDPRYCPGNLVTLRFFAPSTGNFPSPQG